MQREEDLERWRAMKPEDRLRIGIDLTELAWKFLMRLPPEEAQRRLDLARQPWSTPRAPEPER